MQTDKERLLELLSRGNWTPEEEQWLHRRLAEEDPLVQEVLSAYFREDLEAGSTIDPAVSQRMHAQLRERIAGEYPAPVARNPIYRRTAWLAAAAVIIFAAVAAWWWRQPAPLSRQPAQVVSLPIRPGHNGAILTLGNGRQVELDSVGNGAVAVQGNTQIVQRNGQLSYEGEHAAAAPSATVYNELKTPKGRQFHITLPDGTKVWLNAASSLRFPAAFPGGKRMVELQGEAYFEVAGKADQPFFVKVKDMEVAVLGTSFNVNAYGDQGGVFTSLLTGSVRVNSGGATALLQPGQQAESLPQSAIRINKNPDLQQVTAWKNGMFLYRAENIRVIMQQLSRWYDIEVEYAHSTDELFYVELPRNSPLDEVLKILTLTGKVKFKIEGRKIIVS